MLKFDIAFTAQNSKKLDLVDLVEKYRDGISQYSIVATMDTGLFIRRMTGLDMGLIECGSKGGYLQIAKLITQNKLKMVVFLHDPSLNLNEVGVRELLLACNIHNIPFANNVATAEFILHRFLEKEMATQWRCPEILPNHNLISV
jgi:methylglyoxal synthase